MMFYFIYNKSDMKNKIDLKNGEKWLIVTDLDGTFLANTPNFAIPAKNVKAAKLLNELGHKFVMASGRSPQLMSFNHEYLGLTTPMISFHGAYISDPTGNHPELALMNNYMEKDTVKDLIKHIGLLGKVKSTHMIGIGRALEISTEEDLEMLDFNPYEGVMLADKDADINIEELEKIITERYGETISFKFIEGGSGIKENLLLFMAKGTDKLNALKQLSEYYKIPRERIMFFGDNYNDLESIKWAGVGVCVESGMPKVKEAADYIAKGNSHEGAVGKFIIDLLNE